MSLDLFLFRCSGDPLLAKELIQDFLANLESYQSKISLGVKDLSDRELKVLFHSLRNEVDAFGVESLTHELSELDRVKEGSVFREELILKMERLFRLFDLLKTRLKFKLTEIK